MTDDTEILYNIIYHLTDGTQGHKTMSKNIALSAVKLKAMQNIRKGFSPTTFLKPSQGDALHHANS